MQRKLHRRRSSLARKATGSSILMDGSISTRIAATGAWRSAAVLLKSKPLLFDVHRVPPPHCYQCRWDKRPETCARECSQALEAKIEAVGTRLAALVIEPYVLGPGGIIPQPDGYIERAVRAARAQGAL